jgi:hypothetical protein
MNKLFGEAKENLTQSTTNPKKLNYSLSMDDASYPTPRSNPKLEEFKRVVESSYVEHVLNKEKLSRQSSLNTNNSDENLKNSSRNIFNLNNDSMLNYIFDQNQQSELSTFRLNENLSSSRSNAPIKIPFNSAYNIYDESLANNNSNNATSSSFVPQLSNPVSEGSKSLAESNALIEKYFESYKKEDPIANAASKKKISSTGSSLTASPTSTSSLESGKKYSEDIVPTMDEFMLSSSSNIQFKGYVSSTATTPREVKPPETPKTQSGGSSYRKNLLKFKTSKSLNLSKISDQTEPVVNETPIVQQSYAAPKQAQKNPMDILDEIQQFNSIKATNTPQKDYLINSNRSSNEFKFSNITKKKLQPIETNESSKSSVNLFKTYKASKTSANVSNESDTFRNSNNKSLAKNKSASNLAQTQQSTQSPSSSLNKFEKIFFNSNNSKNSANKLQNKPKLKVKKQNRNKNKNNIFNIIDYDDDDDDIEYNENSDGDNTFDIFSSQEDSLDQNLKINKKVDKVELVKQRDEPFLAETSNLKKYDLTIDLGQLSGDDDENSVKKAENIFFKPDLDEVDESLIVNQSNDIKNINNNQEPVRSVAGSVNSTARQQIKPDIIPNLMLDLMDDDKSQSVAASLAKSMCKEIDYKQEMEMIVDSSKNSNSYIPNKPIKPPVRTSEIKLNKLKTNMPIHHYSNTSNNAANYTTSNMNIKQVFLPQKNLIKKRF